MPAAPCMGSRMACRTDKPMPSRLPWLASFIAWTSVRRGLWQEGAIRRPSTATRWRPSSSALEGDAVLVSLFALLEESGGVWRGRCVTRLRSSPFCARRRKTRAKLAERPEPVSSRIMLAAAALRKREFASKKRGTQLRASCRSCRSGNEASAFHLRVLEIVARHIVIIVIHYVGQVFHARYQPLTR